MMIIESQFTWETHTVQIESLEHLDALVIQLEQEGQQAQYPFFGELVRQSRVLMVSFGASLSAVRFYDLAVGQDDYSLGLASDVYVVIFYGGHWTEVPEQELIPYPQAKAALRHFYLTGEKPPDIPWQFGDD